MCFQPELSSHSHSPSHISTEVVWPRNLRATANLYRSCWGGTILYGKMQVRFFPIQSGPLFFAPFLRNKGLSRFHARVGRRLANPPRPFRPLPPAPAAAPRHLRTRRAFAATGEWCRRQLESGERSRGCVRRSTCRYIYVRIYIYIYIYVGVKIYVCVGEYTCACACVCIYVYTYIHTYIYTYIYIYIYLRTRVWPTARPSAFP